MISCVRATWKCLSFDSQCHLVNSGGGAGGRGA